MQEQQNNCKRQRWLKLDAKLLQKILDGHLEQVNSLSSRSHTWDVHIGMLDSIVDMQVRHRSFQLIVCVEVIVSLHVCSYVYIVQYTFVPGLKV